MDVNLKIKEEKETVKKEEELMEIDDYIPNEEVNSF